MFKTERDSVGIGVKSVIVHIFKWDAQISALSNVFNTPIKKDDIFQNYEASWDPGGKFF